MPPTPPERRARREEAVDLEAVTRSSLRSEEEGRESVEGRVSLVGRDDLTLSIVGMCLWRKGRGADGKGCDCAVNGVVWEGREFAFSRLSFYVTLLDPCMVRLSLNPECFVTSDSFLAAHIIWIRARADGKLVEPRYSVRASNDVRPSEHWICRICGPRAATIRRVDSFRGTGRLPYFLRYQTEILETFILYGLRRWRDLD